MKANYITMPREGYPNPNAAHKCSFFSLFLEDALLLSSVVSHIPRFFVRPKKKNEREKMVTLREVHRYFCRTEVTICIFQNAFEKRQSILCSVISQCLSVLCHET